MYPMGLDHITKSLGAVYVSKSALKPIIYKFIQNPILHKSQKTLNLSIITYPYGAHDCPNKWNSAKNKAPAGMGEGAERHYSSRHEL